MSTVNARPIGAGPLAGITVIDLTRVLAGPYCTMMLADMGARVIKVERPGTGDDSRAIGPFVNDVSAYFVSLNRGKESIALDLKDAGDQRIFEALLERADVLIENYRPGTMERLGYGWEALRERYPRLVYAAVSGFGHSGPYQERPAYDLVVQAMGGIMSLTGEPGGAPTRVGTSMGDITAGMFTCAGINAALFERASTGRGQKIDVAMLDSQVAILENAIARLQASGEVPGPIGSRHPSITPFDRFGTADGALVIAAGNDVLFEKLCDVLDRRELPADPRYASNVERTANQAELKREIERVLETRATAHWLERLAAAGVPCGPIQNVAQVLEDPQVVARNMVVSVDDPALGAFRVAGNPIKYSDHADPPHRPGSPALDANRAALLNELGLDDELP